MESKRRENEADSQIEKSSPFAYFKRMNNKAHVYQLPSFSEQRMREK